MSKESSKTKKKPYESSQRAAQELMATLDKIGAANRDILAVKSDEKMNKIGATSGSRTGRKTGRKAGRQAGLPSFAGVPSVSLGSGYKDSGSARSKYKMS